MDVRLAVEALTRLSLNGPLKARPHTASRVACQQRRLHLPTTPYRQRTSTSRWTQAQRRSLSAASSRWNAPASAAAADSPSQNTAYRPHQQQEDQQPLAPSQSTQDRSTSTDEEIAAIVDQTFQPGLNAAKRTSRFFSPYAQQPNRDPSTTQRPWQSARFPLETANRRRFGPPQEENTSNNTYMGRRQVVPSQRSTADMFEEAMGRDPIGSGRGSPRSHSSAGLIDSFIMGETPGDGKDDFNVDDVVDRALGISSSRGADIERPLPKSSLRLGSSVGRSIEIDPTRGFDLPRGLSVLEMRLSANRVRQHYHQQKFHERPGLKRKRLASARWRKKFKAGFQHVVRRVQYLTKMGW